MFKIVIGLPTYNGARTIKKTFDSLKRAVVYCQNSCRCEIEILFIPNGCTDETELIIEKIIRQNKDLTINILKIRKASKSLAINSLIKIKADFVGYIDDDIILEEEVLYNGLMMFNNKRVWAVFADSYPLSCRKGVNFWEKMVYNAMTVRTRFKLLAKPYDLLMGRFVLARRERFPIIPKHIINEDQFLDYVLYPHVKKIKNSLVYYEGVYNLRNYFRRDLRITIGRRQLKRNLSDSLTCVVDNGRSKKINYTKLFNLPFNVIISFIIYRVIYRVSKVLVYIYIYIFDY